MCNTRHMIRIDNVVIELSVVMLSLCVLSTAWAQQPETPSSERRVRVSQPSRDTSDFDVTLAGHNHCAFRILLPEFISYNGVEVASRLHTIHNRWTRTPDGLHSTFAASDAVELIVRVRLKDDELLAELTVKNTSDHALDEVRANVCLGPSHLPGDPAWANWAFLTAELSLDRTKQGRWWYHDRTPEYLQAWTSDRGWVSMHSHPEDPDPEKAAPYLNVVSATDHNYACAIPSLDEKTLLFMIWDAPRCQSQSPFSGNPCMHLRPLIAEKIAPGESATIQGLAGVFSGTREQLDEKIRTFVRMAQPSETGPASP